MEYELNSGVNSELSVRSKYCLFIFVCFSSVENHFKSGKYRNTKYWDLFFHSSSFFYKDILAQRAVLPLSYSACNV